VQLSWTFCNEMNALISLVYPECNSINTFNFIPIESDHNVVRLSSSWSKRSVKLLIAFGHHRARNASTVHHDFQVARSRLGRINYKITSTQQTVVTYIGPDPYQIMSHRPNESYQLNTQLVELLWLIFKNLKNSWRMFQ